MSLLEPRERTRLAALTECSEEEVERILSAAASERIVVVLPSFHTVGDFAGWGAFVMAGGAKSAHLAERDAARALCGAARPGSAVTDVAPRVRLCVGCEAHALRLTAQPERIAHYDRGVAPQPTSTSPVPPFRRPVVGTDAKGAATDKQAPPRETRSRPAPARPPVAAEPQRTAPPPEEAIAAPSLFDAPIATPRARPKRPF